MCRNRSVTRDAGTFSPKNTTPLNNLIVVHLHIEVKRPFSLVTGREKSQSLTQEDWLSGNRLLGFSLSLIRWCLTPKPKKTLKCNGSWAVRMYQAVERVGNQHRYLGFVTSY